MLLNRVLPLHPFPEMRMSRDLLEEIARIDSPQLSPVGFPPLNAWSDEECFTVETELPGIQLDDLVISIEQGRQLVIQGKYGADESVGAHWVKRERGRGAFERRIDLPGPVDAQKVEATLMQGVLTIRLPKAEELRSQRIAVRAV